jgi:hypothetical protein
VGQRMGWGILLVGALLSRATGCQGPGGGLLLRQGTRHAEGCHDEGSLVKGAVNGGWGEARLLGVLWCRL